jgi:hypothetical protein
MTSLDISDMYFEKIIRCWSIFGSIRPRVCKSVKSGNSIVANSNKFLWDPACQQRFEKSGDMYSRGNKLLRDAACSERAFQKRFFCFSEKMTSLEIFYRYFEKQIRCWSIFRSIRPRFGKSVKSGNSIVANSNKFLWDPACQQRFEKSGDMYFRGNK